MLNFLSCDLHCVEKVACWSKPFLPVWFRNLNHVQLAQTFYTSLNDKYIHVIVQLVQLVLVVQIKISFCNRNDKS